MLLVMVDVYGVLNVCIVLFKCLGESGFVFYLNSLSIKGDEFKVNLYVVLCMYWKSICW